MLTFPYRSPERLSLNKSLPSKFSHKPLLGDIAIAYDFAKLQAETHQIPFDQECVLLAIHGALHLAGYDDTRRSSQQEMMKKMQFVWESLGNPSMPHWFTCTLAEIAKPNSFHLQTKNPDQSAQATKEVILK